MVLVWALLASWQFLCRPESMCLNSPPPREQQLSTFTTGRTAAFTSLLSEWWWANRKRVFWHYQAIRMLLGLGILERNKNLVLAAWDKHISNRAGELVVIIPEAQDWAANRLDSAPLFCVLWHFCGQSCTTCFILPGSFCSCFGHCVSERHWEIIRAFTWKQCIGYSNHFLGERKKKKIFQ